MRSRSRCVVQLCQHRCFSDGVVGGVGRRNMIFFDPESMASSQSYRLLTHCIIPRPIALITTLNTPPPHLPTTENDEDGQKKKKKKKEENENQNHNHNNMDVVSDDVSVNVAPFSFFAGISSSPLTLCVSITSPSEAKKKKDANGAFQTVAKDTLRNIELRKEFVVNCAHVSEAAWINDASRELAYGESELMSTPWTLRSSRVIMTPQLEQSAWSCECVVWDTLQIGERGREGSATLVVGKIVAIHVDSQVMQIDQNEGQIQKKEQQLGEEEGKKKIVLPMPDAEKIQPLARLGGSWYAGISKPFQMKRPK